MAKQKKGDLDVFNFGFALGVVFALFMVILGFMSWWIDWGTLAVIVISDIYFGYGPSLLGVIMGAIWGFIDGFVAGALFAWIYNSLKR